MQFTSRPYRDYTDLEKMRRFIIRARTRHGHMGGYFHVGDLLWQMFSFGWFRPKQDIRLWLDSPDHLLGFAWYYTKRHAVELQVFPRHEAIERDMLAWAESHWQNTNGNGRKRLLTSALETDSDRISLLTELGYVQEENHYVHWLRLLNGTIPIPKLPDGFTIRHIEPEDVPNRVAVHRAAFHPSQLTNEIYEGLLQAPGYVPELDLVVEGPDGRFVAFCICWLDPVNRTGEFEPMGTHPDFWRKGLGTAVMLAGLERMKAFGAEQALVYSHGGNEASTRLYQSLGFEPVNLSYDFVKYFDDE